MQVCRYCSPKDQTPRLGLLEAGKVYALAPYFPGDVAELLALPDPLAALAPMRDKILTGEPLAWDKLSRPPSSEGGHILPPLDKQEVWAAGVTYLRSKDARMLESETSATVYDQVYAAERPEIFFKATPHRVVGPFDGVGIRADSHWNVPEPELALVIGPDLKLKGFTCGNDMSSRDIEGANPLYLPQAKVYNGCCALGPAITLAGEGFDPSDLAIRLSIGRAGVEVFSGETTTANIKRGFDELIGYLGKSNRFPAGAFLLTGTGVVPGEGFTLAAGDLVRITIEGIGELTNPVTVV